MNHLSIGGAVLLAVALFPAGAGAGPTGVAGFAPDTINPRAVALLPTFVDSTVPNAAVGRRVMDSLIAVSLEAAGYVILPPELVDPVWRGTVDSAGGYYDPATGDVLTGKLVAIRASVAHQLGAGGLLRAHAGVIRFPYSRKKPLEYGGVSEVVATGSSGAVPALLLAASISDSTGTTVQCGLSGIQLLEKGTAWDNRAHPVKPEKVFADAERNAAAVQRVLGGFLQHQPSCAPAQAD